MVRGGKVYVTGCNSDGVAMDMSKMIPGVVFVGYKNFIAGGGSTCRQTKVWWDFGSKAEYVNGLEITDEKEH